jgi:nucleoside-diphosphate-sugar epimerase
MNERVVVTGASGFVGSYLVAALVGRGDEVVATSRHRPAYLDARAFRSVRFVPADVRDRAALAPALEGARRVYHSAAVFDFYAKERELLSVNADGTSTLVDMAIASGVSEFVNISSGAVYGIRYGNQVVGEDASPSPADKYARSKWEQEKRVVERASPTFKVASLRPGAIYGPGSRYGDAIAMYLLKKGILFGTPCLSKVISSHVHVDDVCRAAIHLGDRALTGTTTPDPGSVAYNTSDSSPTFNEELLREVAALVPEKGLLGFWRHVRIPAFGLKLAAYLAEAWAAVRGVRPLFEVASIDYITCGHGLSNKKLLATGFELAHPSLVDGLKETVQWYEATGWRVFKDPTLLYDCVRSATA